MASKDLSKKLKKIRKVFNTEDITEIKIDIDYIQKYYAVNSVPYSLLHTLDDFMYMGISRDGKYKKEDLKEQARIIDKFIKEKEAQKVLELASGRSATTTFLACQNPNTDFFGIELSEGQIKHARKKETKYTNLKLQKGDYHDLSVFESGSFDIVYIIEALCYSTEKEKVLSEVYRILKSGGLFIIFDGYRSDKNLDETEEIACILTEKSMALAYFENYSTYLKYAINNGFVIKYEEDLSNFVLPTMEKFEKISKIVFNFPSVGNIIRMSLPDEFTHNSIAGYLMPTLVTDKVALYMLSVLEKQ